jgi:hypothetical protein
MGGDTMPERVAAAISETEHDAVNSTIEPKGFSAIGRYREHCPAAAVDAAHK